MARLVAAKRGQPERVEQASDPDDPDRELFDTDGLRSPHATIGGPTIQTWLADEGA